MNTCVDVRGAQVCANGRRVLDGVDLVVAAGEVHGLIGLPGSGASTLAGVIKGQQRLLAGSARV